MAICEEAPAFTVTDMKTGHRYAIFADGRTHGFGHLEQAVVVNNIPRLIAEASVCLTCAVRAGRLVQKHPTKPVFRTDGGWMDT